MGDFRYRHSVDAAPIQTGDLLLSPDAPVQTAALPRWFAMAEADGFGLTPAEFAEILAGVGAKLNYNLPPGARPTALQQEAFFEGLHLADLALARGCALGREAAWQRMFALYRTPLERAAVAITGQVTLGTELAESLYAELYGLRTDAESSRRSPLVSYTGRGSFLGWLRATLAQRHVDHLRRTRRETALEDFDAPDAPAAVTPQPEEVGRTTDALRAILTRLPGEDRYLLASYFLDQRTLADIARVLRVHEATISRRIKRLTGDLRHRLIEHLQAGGLSRRSAEEALGLDPRDIEINLRKLLQTSESPPFSERTSREGSRIAKSVRTGQT